MRSIAVVMPTFHAYQQSTLRGIASFFSANPDWRIVLFPAQKSAMRQIRQLKPEGLIVHRIPDDWLTSIDLDNCRLVSLYGNPPHPKASVVTLDNVACGRLMARHLMDCGGRQFVFYGRNNPRLQGFRQEIGPHRPLYTYPRPGYVKRIHHGTKWQRELMQWLKKQPRPLAIGAYNDVLGYSTLEVCRMMDIRVPEEIMVLGADNDRTLCHMAWPALSSVSIPWQRIGAEAVRLLTRKIESKRKQPETVIIPPVRVIPRASTDVSLAVNEDVAAATQFIRANVSHPNLDVPQVAAAVAMSPSSLQRRFQKHLGYAVLEQIQRTRLTQAKRLLVETGLPVKTIAKRVGFRSVERMAKVFQQHMKMKPREFRARFRYPTAS